jgi:hypothetical protein
MTATVELFLIVISVAMRGAHSNSHGQFVSLSGMMSNNEETKIEKQGKKALLKLQWECVQSAT